MSKKQPTQEELASKVFVGNFASDDAQPSSLSPAEGIAARFVSGYQKGNLLNERCDLHAWPEVYLPGASWCEFDPTHGEAVIDTHVTIAAAAHSCDTMPVNGVFSGAGITSTLEYTIEIQVL